MSLRWPEPNGDPAGSQLPAGSSIPEIAANWRGIKTGYPAQARRSTKSAYSAYEQRAATTPDDLVFNSGQVPMGTGPRCDGHAIVTLPVAQLPPVIPTVITPSAKTTGRQDAYQSREIPLHLRFNCRQRS